MAYSLYKLVNWFLVTEKQRHIRSSVSSITPISHYHTLNIPHTKKEMYTACLRLQITAKLTPQISNKCRCKLEAGCDLRRDALASTLPLKWLISHFDGQCEKNWFTLVRHKPRGPQLVTPSLDHANCSMQMIPTDTVFTVVSQHAESIWLKQQLRIMIHTTNN